MAKAGFWLRGARGKIAGASAQKGQNGTILREIVTPRNPKTDKQIYQRAIMATVMKAYSAGKQIFDHAFQGVEKGQKSQQYFIAKNASLLRSNIAQEINAIAAGTLQPTAAVHAAVAPKALYAVPGAYMISEGTYDQSFFVLQNTGTNVSISFPEADDEETIATFAQRTGLIPGDIYTVVALVVNNQIVFNGVDESGQLSNNVRTKQKGCVFAIVRAQVKADVLTNTEGYENLESVFEITLENNPIINGTSTRAITTPFEWTRGDFINGNDGSFAIIRSRLDEDLRSTTYMTLVNASVNATAGFGITSPYILPTWKKGTDALGTSEKILESDENSGSGFVSA